MRILYMGNGWTGWQVLEWLRREGEEIVGLVIHPHARQRFGKEILEAAQLDAARVFYGDSLRDPAVVEQLRALEPEIGLSVYFGHILKPNLLELFPKGCLNLHPALLPFNRGAYPNVWSIIDETPAGVTLHYIDSGIDTGDIVAQEVVTILPTDTGETLYRRLELAALDLVRREWGGVRQGTLSRVPQVNSPGTYHRASDVNAVDRIELEKTYTAKELLNLMRARTFPPYPGAYFMHEGKRIYLRLQLLTEGEL
jgi:methionyl-tRNA formyltransferase